MQSDFVSGKCYEEETQVEQIWHGWCVLPRRFLLTGMMRFWEAEQQTQGEKHL